MDNNSELLRRVRDNAATGREALGLTIKRCGDAGLRHQMAVQFAEYDAILKEADALAPAFGLLAEGNRAKRAPMRIGLKLNTLIDSTSSHLGEMLLQGYVMGIIDMTRAQREYPAEDKDILGLAKKLVETEDANFLAIREWL